MKLAVVGASGRMGRTLIRALDAMEGTCVGAAIEREGAQTLGQDAGEIAQIGPLGITISADAAAGFAQCDGVLDFTAPSASTHYAQLAAKAGIVHIIGTTGFTPADEAAIAKSSAHTPIVKSGNMSFGVNLLAILVEQAARALKSADYDIEVLEMHHKHKVDAPSGTALLLGEAAAKGRDIDLRSNATLSREGQTGARSEGSIGFATLRGGAVIGDHSVLLAGSDEIITLSHHASDRSLFANGAVKAALWARSQKPGLYSMRDVLGLS